MSCRPSVVPPLTNADMRALVRKNREPGTVPGVHYQKALPTRTAYWIARIEVPVNAYVPGYVEEPGPSRNKKGRRQITRSFSIKRYGDEDARRLAEEERLRMLAAIKDASEPALRSERAKELHRELQGDERER